LTINAMKSAFLPYRERLEIIYDRIKPGYARALASLGQAPAEPYDRR
jgi:hypothetical protein